MGRSFNYPTGLPLHVWAAPTKRHEPDAHAAFIGFDRFYGVDTLGGNEVDANALLRFYVLHCVILPLVAVLLVAVHFWRIRKDGGLYVPEKKQ